MAELAQLLKNVDGARVLCTGPSPQIREVCDDSRRVGAGDLFVAVPGSKVDGA